MRLRLLSVVVVAALALGYFHPFGDPRAESPKGLGTLLQHADMPAPAKAILVSKCANCHSSETHYPIYSRIAPASWLMERDIVDARKHMDLSNWDSLTPDRQQVLEAKIVQEARGGHMPPPQYLLLHWDAKLSAADTQTLATLSHAIGDAEPSLTGTGDAANGKLLFEKRCTGCHALDASREGPKLSGVYGRKAGTVPGYSYSAALKSSGITWDDRTLDKWLTDSDVLVPGNNMDFQVPKAQERSDLIAYFLQLK
jgi:cytochrome c